jgi:hypothetical protein
MWSPSDESQQGQGDQMSLLKIGQNVTQRIFGKITEYRIYSFWETKK